MSYKYYPNKREMRKFAVFFLIVLFTVLLVSSSVFAEGSKQLNSNNSSKRFYTMGINAANDFNPEHDATLWNSLPNSKKWIYVYAKKGETINIGTSFTTNSVEEVRVYDPDGNYTSYNVTTTSDGYIKNYLQERCGPTTIFGGSGTCTSSTNYYTPIKITVSKTGTYRVSLYSKTSVKYQAAPDSSISPSTDQGGVPVNSALYSYRGGIAAWDITVASGSTAKNGRVYMYMLRGFTSNNTTGVSYNHTLYVLTADGLRYKMTLPESQYGSMYFFASPQGLIVPSGSAAGKSVYHSVLYSQTSKYNVDTNFHRLFFNEPDADILADLGLSSVASPPTISNIKFIGDAGTVVKKGNPGKITFTSSAAGITYQLVGYETVCLHNLIGNIDAATPSASPTTSCNDGILVTAKNTISAGTVKSGSNTINIPSVESSLTLYFFQGETHFAFFDIEGNYGGVTLRRLNGSSLDRNIYYYDNSKSYSNGILYGEVLDLSNATISSDFYGSDGSMWYSHDDGNGIIADIWGNQKFSTKPVTPDIVETLTKNITVTKSWSDSSNKFSTRPSSIIFDAYAGSSTTRSGTCTANSSGSWKCTISNLDIYDSNGNEITYTIKERTVPSGYTAGSNPTVGSSATTATFTNTLQTKDVTVTKTWSDSSNKFSTRPASLVFHAYIGTGTTSMGSCTANASNSWKCTISGLAKVDSSGNAISYTIKEATVPSGYTQTTGSVTTANGTTSTVKNTLQTKDITVTKAWTDSSNAYGTRPASLIFDAFIGSGTTSVGNCTANESNSWSCSISGLAMYDVNGAAIVYTVKERAVPTGYQTTNGTITTATGITATVRNTLETVEIDVVKVWEDDGNRDFYRPQQIGVNLLRGSTVIATVSLPSDESQRYQHQWTHKFTGIPKYDINGEVAKYTVKEVTKQ